MMFKKTSNKARFKTLRQNESGIILITAIWIIAILSLLAIGLSRSLSVDLILVKQMVRQLHARFALRSAAPYLLNDIHQVGVVVDRHVDWNMSLPCGYSFEKRDKFKDVPVGDFAVFDMELPDQNELIGLQDARARLNLNQLNNQNYVIFAHLIAMQERLSQEDAYDIALAVVDWIDEDDEVTTTVLGSGAEQEIYGNLKVKNKPMIAIEELLMVKGMTQEIFATIKPYITAYVEEDNPWILFNINMADPVLLTALGHSFPNANQSTVKSTVERIDEYRRGYDGELCTADDRSVIDHISDEEELVSTLSQTEAMVFQNLKTLHHMDETNLLLVQVKGKDRMSSQHRTAMMMLDLSDKQIAYWKNY